MASITLMSLLPVAMIMTNGIVALRSILYTPSLDHTLGSELNETLSQTEGQTIKFGVYDPYDTFDGEQLFQLRHVYVPWNQLASHDLKGTLQNLVDQGFEPLVTIEPLPLDNESKDLLSSILAGDYDGVIKELATSLQGLKGPIYIAWGHEMDRDISSRYPWSCKDPETYRQAYRYVVDRVRSQVKADLRWIWVAVMEENCLDYYPGDDYVDYVGTTLYGFPAFDRKTRGSVVSFRNKLDAKLDRVQSVNKPVFLTELGVTGGINFEELWMSDAFGAFQHYPNLAGVVFFYANDTANAWGDDIPTPDWRCHPETIRQLVDWKLESQR